MSAPDLDRETMGTLHGFASAPDHVSFLLGAGASATVGLPDWDTLAVRLLVRSGAVSDDEAAVAFPAQQDPTLAAEAARSSAGHRWPTILREALYDAGPESPSLVPSVLHLAVAGYATAREPGRTGLFTLNFDLVLEAALEDALAERGSTATVFSRPTAAPRAQGSAYEVSHLHGLISPDPAVGPKSVILTLSEFTGITDPAWQLAALHEALQRGPMLIAGTSLRDPDIRQWIYDLTRGEQLQTPTVILARAGMGLSPAQFSRVRSAVSAQWESIGITPVLVNDYADAAQAIREVGAMDSEGYLAPQERAAILLGSCFDSFSALQQQHAQQLEQDQASLQAVLGRDTNLTLWLADGQGQLVRWASPDRVYRSPRQLRRVPAGHDSPWIAGKCLARDDFVALPASPDPDNIRRWRSVVASPVGVHLAGGPDFTSGVLTSATADPLDSHDVDEWWETLKELAGQWSARLEQCVD